MFSPNARVFGLEIGTQYVRVAHLAGSHSHVIKAVNEVPLAQNPWLKNGLRDKEGLAKQLSTVLKEAQPHPITIKRAVATLPESVVYSKIIKLPKLSPKELVQTLPYEAAEFLPLPLEEVYLDWQLDHASKHSKRSFIHALVVAAPKQIVDDLTDLTKSLGIELTNLESEPFAICRSLNHLLHEHAASVVLNIGSSNTTIIIATRRTIKFTSTLLLGAGKLGKDLESNLTTIADEVEESINYYHNRLEEKEEIKEVLLTGAGATVETLKEKLHHLVRLPIDIGRSAIELPGNATVHPRFNAVIGLAAWDKHH